MMRIYYTPYIALFLTLLINPVIGLSQNSGYQGKKFIIRTDLITPILQRGFDVEFDWVAHRHLMIGLSTAYTADKYLQKIESYKTIFGNYPSTPSQVKDLQIALSTIFFFDNAIPAPKGSFAFGKYSAGRATITGNIFENEFMEFTLSNVRASSFEIGLGHQEVYFDKMTFSFTVGLKFARLNAAVNSDTIYNTYIDSFDEKYAPNLASFGSWGDFPGGVGINIGAKIGFLAF